MCAASLPPRAYPALVSVLWASFARALSLDFLGWAKGAGLVVGS